MKKSASILTAALLCAAAGAAFAAGGDLGQTAKQETNWTAIVMFAVFVAATLWITKWAAARTKSAASFYNAGGGITGFQNGLAIAGDYMSAASFLGISAMVMGVGYDGLIYSIGFLVGWPVITFLMAERLRNLGKFTFADVAGYRFQQGPIRIFAACGTLVVVAFYLIAQMVGAGQLIKLLFGLDYGYAVAIVGALMMVYVLFGGMTATTWVQIIKACMLLAGVTFMAIMVLSQYGFSPEALFAKAVEVKTAIALGSKTAAIAAATAASAAASSPEAAASAAAALAKAQALDPAKEGLKVMGPGVFLKDPVSAISFGMALMFGTAGLPHILMRFFTVPDAKEARKSVLWATTWIGYFYILIFIIGFGAITLVLTNPEVADVVKGTIKGGAGHGQYGGGAGGQDGGRQRVLRLHLGRGLRHHPGCRCRFDAFGRLGRLARPLRHGDQEGQGRQRFRAAHVAHHHLRTGHPGGGAGLRVRADQCRLHGGAGLRDRGLGQLPGAVPLSAVEGLHDQGRGDRRLPGPDLVGGPDHRLALGVGSHAAQPQGLGLVPLHVALPVLDDHRLRRRLAVLDPGSQPRCGCRTRGICLTTGTLRNRPGCLGRVGPLTVFLDESQALQTVPVPKARPSVWLFLRLAE